MEDKIYTEKCMVCGFIACKCDSCERMEDKLSAVKEFYRNYCDVSIDKFPELGYGDLHAIRLMEAWKNECLQEIIKEIEGMKKQDYILGVKHTKETLQNDIVNLIKSK